MDYVTRINLKTSSTCSREEVISFCLLNDAAKQYIAIGWSYIYKTNNQIVNYKDYYDSVRNDVERLNHALNVFFETKENDLFWTRDLDGFYWICRAKGGAQSIREAGLNVDDCITMDIGAVVPVEAYKCALEVPGAIKAAFNRPRGGIAERIRNDLIISYSMYVFNGKSTTYKFDLKPLSELMKESSENFILNLPDFELEELIISYIQIKYNYYLLSNSIAKKSTTIKIEGEFYSRDINNFNRAVVQVKGPGRKEALSAKEFQSFIDRGYIVFLYAEICDTCGEKNVIKITKNDILNFYQIYKSILPESITKWENIFNK